MLTFIWKVFQNKKKEYYTLLMIMSLVASFEFCCLAMYYTISQFTFDLITGIVAHALPSFSAFVTFALNILIVKYFIENIKQEFSILLLSGRKPKDLFVYMIVQYGILTLLSFAIGLLGGTALMALFNLCLNFFAIPFRALYSFSNTLFLYIIFSIITIVFILAISTSQFVQLDKQLVIYLSHKKSSEKGPYKVNFSAISQKHKFPFLSVLSFIFIIYITIYSTLEIVYSHTTLLMIFRYYSFALAGVILLINSTLPFLYDLCHHWLVRHPILIQGIACFQDFSKVMSAMVNLNATLIPTILFMIIMSGQNLLFEILIIPCFIMTLIIICLCFILKYTFYDKKIREHMATYYAIGYQSNILKKILLTKNMIFIIWVIMIPLLLFIQLAYKAWIENYLSFEVCLTLVFVYIFSYLIVVIYIFIKEKKMLKEVTSHVKDINRGA